MKHAGGDSLYDYWEYHYRHDAADTSTVGYRFVLRDGGAEFRPSTSWPMVLDPARMIRVPEWAKNAVWYQIMVDRFRDGDPNNNPEFTKGTERSEVTHPWRSDWYVEQPWEREGGQTFWRWSMYNRLYGGDFRGLMDKLDYLKELGVTAIYLNPVFEATNSHKYNARSYMHADDGYGVPGEFARAVAIEDPLDPSTWIFNKSDELLLELIREIKKRDMRIIFDGVFNHLGSDAIFFQDVRERGPESPYADWFDIVSWEPFQYTGWAGFDGLPQFRKDAEHGLASESLRRHIYDVTRRWMDPNGDGDPSDGIDGWRLDVPMDVPKPFWVEWRKVVKNINPEAYIVGEIWDPAEDWLDGTTFDAVMNYQFAQIAFRFFGNVERKTTATEFDRELARLRTRYPRAHTEVLQNLFDSHDTDRWVSRLANPDLPYDGGNRKQDSGPDFFDKRPEARHYQRLRLMAIFQTFYLGSPMIWYGTEVGMFGADDPHCRMPMWWEDMMPFDNPEYRMEPGLFSFFSSLYQLRNSHRVLRTGDYATLLADDLADAFAYIRWDSTEREAFIVIVNNSEGSQQVHIPAPDPEILPAGFRSVTVALESAPVRGMHRHQGLVLTPSADPRAPLVVSLPALSGGVLRIARRATD
jgi:glycosidase